MIFHSFEACFHQEIHLCVCSLQANNSTQNQERNRNILFLFLNQNHMLKSIKNFTLIFFCLSKPWQFFVEIRSVECQN